MMNYTIATKSISEVARMSETPVLRIAVSNVVWTINGELMGILSKGIDNSPIKKVGLIWGGANLIDTPNKLMKMGAFDFEWIDARFKIPVDNIYDFVNIETGELTFLCEQDVMREVKEELTEENDVISKNDLFNLHSEYIGTSVFLDSSKKLIEGLNLRIINIFELKCPDTILGKIKSSSVIYPLTREIMNDGFKDPNIILKDFIPPTIQYLEWEKNKEKNI